MTEHKLKTWPEPFEALYTGKKKYEIRKNDRNFKPGDILLLRHYNPTSQKYGDLWIRAKITHMEQGKWGLPPDLCVMSIAPLSMGTGKP